MLKSFFELGTNPLYITNYSAYVSGEKAIDPGMAEPVAKPAELDHRCRAQQAIDELAGTLESIRKVAIRPVRAYYVIYQHVAVGDHDVHREAERSVPPDRCDLVLRDLAFGGLRAECVPWLD